MKPYTKTAAKYYDIFLQLEVNLAPREVKLFREFWGNKVKRVLDCGCGTARLSLELAHAGYDVTGIDITPAMLEVAKQKTRGMKTRFLVADMCRYLSKTKFDAIVCGSNTVPHLMTDRGIVAFFNCCFKNLEKNGVLIFDIWEADELTGAYSGERNIGGVHLKYKEFVHRPDKNNMVKWVKHVEIEDDGKKLKFPFGGKLKYRDRNELKRLLKEAGFARVRAKKMKTFRNKTYFIATKNNFI